jgi:hypothetical protein
MVHTIYEPPHNIAIVFLPHTPLNQPCQAIRSQHLATHQHPISQGLFTLIFVAMAIDRGSPLLYFEWLEEKYCA